MHGAITFGIPEQVFKALPHIVSSDVILDNHLDEGHVNCIIDPKLDKVVNFKLMNREIAR